MMDVVSWLREGAEVARDTQDDLGLVLDGSLESIEEIEDYVDACRAEPGGREDPERYQLIFALGAYIGEVIIAEAGCGSWAPGSEDPADPWQAHVRCDDGELQIDPLGKVLRRYERGPEEGLVDFAKLAIAVLKGDVGFEIHVVH